MKELFADARKPFAIACALGIAASLCAVLLMFTSGYLISRTAEAGCLLVAIMTPVACVQLFGLGKPLARYFERLHAHDAVFRLTSRLRRRLFANAAHAPALQRARTSSGAFLGLLANDIGHLQDLFLRVCLPTLCALGVYALAVIAVGAFSWPFALVLALALCMVCIVLPLQVLTVQRLALIAHQARVHASYDELTDNVLGSADWVLAGRGTAFVEAQRRTLAELSREGRSIRRTQRVARLASTLFLGLVACVVAVWAGGFFSGQAEGGSANLIAAFTLAVFPLIEVVVPLCADVPQVANHVDAVDRLLAFDEGPARTSAEAPIFDETAPLLELSNVTFRYPGSPGAACVVDELVIDAGRIALIGASGSGKSTLCRLIAGDYSPDAGQVRYRGVATASLGTGRAGAIGVLPQHPHLFNRTLRENLMIGARSATDEQMRDALEQVGLGPLLAALPAGLDTLLGEEGNRFSGGEGHRIALARLLLADARLIILDEPCTALDPATESALLDTVFEAATGRTLLMITHHLEHLDRFGRVLMMDRGAIVADGSPAAVREMLQ